MLIPPLVAVVLAAGAVSCTAPDTPTGVGTATGKDQPAARLRVEPCPTRTAAARAADGPPLMTLPCFGSPGQIRLPGLRNTVVNVWASWCAPCREELPLLQATHRRWGESIRMLGIDSRDEASAAAAFLTATGVTYPQALDTSGQLPGRLGSPGLPVTIAIDAVGTVVYQHAGKLSTSDVATIQRRLGG